MGVSQKGAPVKENPYDTLFPLFVHFDIKQYNIALTLGITETIRDVKIT